MATEQTQPDRPCSMKDLENAVEEMTLLRGFPEGEGPRAALVRLLGRMVPHRRALFFLIELVVAHHDRWPGPRELRGLLCTRFDPADGIEMYAETPGFTAEDNEARFLARQAEEVKFLTAGEMAPESAEMIRLLAEKKKLL